MRFIGDAAVAGFFAADKDKAREAKRAELAERVAPFGRLMKPRCGLCWVGGDALPGEVRMYSTLFNRPDPGAGGDLDADLNPASLEVVSGALLEPSLADMPVGEAVQFERQGYFCAAPAGRPDAPVFNLTIGLRETWAKMQVGG